MKRFQIAQRPDYVKKIEELGFKFHPDYWLENAYYQISSNEQFDLETASLCCYQMYCDAVERCIYDDKLLDRLRIPQAIRPFVQKSWDDNELSLYGRFDFALTQNGLKLLEFNADTPTSLLEAAVIQWQWKEELFSYADQFNSIQENLIQSWNDISYCYKAPEIFFASVLENEEDNITVDYLLYTAMQGGVNVAELDMQSLWWEKNHPLLKTSQNGDDINCLFKLYPLEDMFTEKNIEFCMTQTHLIEPLWKSLMSNKAMLPILYEMFPNSPYLLKCYDMPKGMTSYCKKPIFSREGANVELVVNNALLEKSDGEYGQEGYVYQEFADIISYDGKYPVLGSWIVGGEACGLGIRETSSRITDNMAHFVPHIILD